LLSGTPPFKRDGGLAVVWAKLSEDPPLLSPRREDLPAAIDDVMTRGMARAPAERFGTCGEFAAALREVLGLRSPDSGPRSVPPSSRPPTEIAMPTVPPAARGSDPGVAAPAGAASDPWSAARLAAGSAAAAGSGAAVGSAAGSFAPPGQAAPSAPPASAGGSAPSMPAEASAPAGAAGGSASAGGSAPSAPAGAAGRPPAGPPTEVAQVPGTGSTRPGLTEPSLPVPPPTDYRAASDYPLPPDYRTVQSGPAPVRRVAEPRGRGPQGAGTIVAPRPRPAWWRSRGAMAAAAVIVVLGVVGGVFAALHHSNTSTGSGGGGGGGGHGTTGQAVAVKLPACSVTAATAHQVSGVRVDSATVGGSPFGVVVTPNGRYSFVSTGNEVAVLNNDGGSLAPTQVATVPASGAQKDEAITSNGRYLLAAAGSGVYVISVSKAEAGDGSGAVLGTLAGPPGNPANEVLASADGKLVFVTFQNNGDVAVFNLHQAIGGGFGQAGYLGMVQLGAGSEPQAMAQSPDGRWLYVTGESQSGRLYVVDISKVATDPRHAVTSSAAAGCAPARVIVSANGDDVWVTDRDANALLAFSAEKLRSDPAHSLIAQVGVGQTPIGLAFVNGGTAIMVADANTRGVQGADNLALVSTRLALLGQGGALQGFIPSGAVPRELAVVPGGKTLLVTNNTNSGQLQAVDLGSLP
jgi:Lactonase, 7-bladed beta-propeller